MKLYHDKPRRAAVMPKDENGNSYLDKEYVKAVCQEVGLFELPRLNVKLYLHFKGFKKIQALEEYSNVKAIWLEGNGIEAISGLDQMT
jgi:hypothetical protein